MAVRAQVALEDKLPNNLIWVDYQQGIWYVYTGTVKRP